LRLVGRQSNAARAAEAAEIAAQGPPATVPAALLSGEPLGRAKFQSLFDALLRRMEQDAPYTKYRELTERIKVGTAKIAAAKDKGYAGADLIKAEETLAELHAEVNRLTREYLAPHFAAHAAWSVMDAAQGRAWPLERPGYVIVSLPGIAFFRVEIETEAPF